MKIFNSRKNWKIIKKIWEQKQADGIFSSILNNYGDSQDFFLEDYEMEEVLQRIEKHKTNKNVIMQDYQFVILEMLYAIMSALNISLPDYMLSSIIAKSRVFKTCELNQNPYLKNIKIQPVQEGNFRLNQNKYKKYEFFVCDCFYDEPTTTILPVCSYIDDDYYFPQITENDEVWMSISPSEIITMVDSIDKAHGDVLTLGCGLGYFAYMTAIKPEVKSVTIIEKSPEVINLFKKHILSQFGEIASKINIIEADAIEYVQNLNDGVYDFCFADIWKSSIDVETYLKIKQLEKNFSKMEIAYWIEFNIVATTIRPMVLLFIFNNFLDRKMEETIIDTELFPQIKIAKDFVEEIFADVYIKTPEDILYYTNPTNILALINEKYKNVK